MQTNSPDYSAMGRKSVQTRRLAAVERRIRELVDSAPPLTPEQRSALAGLLLNHPGAAV